MSNTNMVIKKRMFNDAYYPYLKNYDKRFEVYYGGAGSGKSVFVTQKLLFKYLSMSGRKCLVVRKVNATLKDSVFALFKTILNQWQIADECKINKTDLTIELPNGSSFLFKGMDDPEKIKSIANIDDIWVEEATELQVEDFDQLGLRLRSKKPYNQIFVSFNPVSKDNFVYKRWFKDGYNIGNTMVLHTTYEDNKFLPKEYIDALMEYKKNNPIYFSIYALGEFATLDRLVYTNWEVSEQPFDYNQILKEKSNRVAIFGTDFGYTNDYTTLICSIIDEAEKKIWIYDEHFEKHMTNEDIYNMYVQHRVAGERIICDSSEPKSIEELKRFGCKHIEGAVKGKDSIMNGIQLIQQYQIIVHPDCTQIQEELRNYTFIKDKQTNEYINKPIDKYNHGLDGFRYSVMNHVGVVKGKVILYGRNLLF